VKEMTKKQKEQIWHLCVGAMSVDALREHFKKIQRTRRRGISYGVNGYVVIVKRSLARDYVRDKLEMRDLFSGK